MATVFLVASSIMCMSIAVLLMNMSATSRVGIVAILDVSMTMVVAMAARLATMRMLMAKNCDHAKICHQT
jgi:hypothetical protein